MKALLSLAGVLILFIPAAQALTSLHQITSEKDCPANLKVRLEPPESTNDLVIVSVTLAPHVPEAYEGRVKAFCRLQVASSGTTVFDGNVEATKGDGGFRCRFRIHSASLKESQLSLSTQLYERDGHPTLGGGEIYEISLRGFARPSTGKPNTDGAANGSRPIPPETNRTSAAAGSHR